MKTINLVSAHPNPWLRQFPKGIPEWDGWRFVFNSEDQDYDYLVVFDELHAPVSISCNPQNVIHLSTEPPLVRHYSEEFLSQFAWTIRQGDRKEIEGAIYHQPGLNWHVGWKPSEDDTRNMLNFEQIEDLFEQPKSKLISVISSNITISPQHQARLKFAQKLKDHYGDKIDFYGRGFVTMDDKLEALKDYRFHVVLENSSFNHYFSEKLTDCILSGTYPLYYGCKNIDKYFAENSYRQIDIHNFEDSVKIIDHAINEALDKKYRPQLSEARDLILNKHNLFPMLIDLIELIEKEKFGPPNSAQRIKNLLLMPLAQDIPTEIEKPSSINSVLSDFADKFILLDALRSLYRYFKVRGHAK